MSNRVANRRTRREVIAFLALTGVFSAAAYIPIIQAESKGEQANFVGLLMFAPGLAAVITYLVFERSLRAVGWRPGKLRYLIAGLVIPLLYCLIEYGLAWLAGWGGFNGQFPPRLPIFLATMLVLGTLSALLEEVAWRGLLAPKLRILTGFTNAALLTGVIWAVWHYPLIIYADVRLGNTPLPYSLVCFTVFVVGVSFATAWLRLKSGSVWPSAVLHGSHNVLMLHVFNTLTTDTGGTWLLLGEYGALTAVMGVVLGVLFWRWRLRLPAAG